MSPIFIGCGIVTEIGPTRDLRVVRAEIHRRGQQDGQARQREDEVGEAHEQVVGAPAVVPGQRADRGSDRGRENRDEQCDPERRPDPVDDPAEIVAAELIGAEDVPAVERRRRGETGGRIDVVEVDLVEAVGSDLLREDRDEREEDQDDEADDGHLVAEEAHARVRPLTARFDLDAGLVREVGVRCERGDALGRDDARAGRHRRLHHPVPWTLISHSEPVGSR